MTPPTKFELAVTTYHMIAAFIFLDFAFAVGAGFDDHSLLPLKKLVVVAFIAAFPPALMGLLAALKADFLATVTHYVFYPYALCFHL